MTRPKTKQADTPGLVPGGGGGRMSRRRQGVGSRTRLQLAMGGLVLSAPFLVAAQPGPGGSTAAHDGPRMVRGGAAPVPPGGLGEGGSRAWILRHAVHALGSVLEGWTRATLGSGGKEAWAARLDERLEAGRDAVRNAEDRDFQDRVLQAGTPIPPGLPAARISQLQGVRSQALEELRAQVDPARGPEAQRWREHLRQLLDDPAHPDELWVAAARTSADLELYELVQSVAVGLDPSRDVREAAARRSLHRFCRRWFKDRSEFEAFWSEAAGLDRGTFFLATLDQLEATSRARLIRIFEERPNEALHSLDDPDPAVRIAAARVVRSSFGSEGFDSAGSIERLLETLDSEADPEVFQALVDGLLAPLVAAAPDDPSVVRMRSGLFAALDRGYGPLQLPALRALARLPWDSHPNGPEGHPNGSEGHPNGSEGTGLLYVLQRLAAHLDSHRAPEGAWVDETGLHPDLIGAALQSMQVLAARAERDGLGALLPQWPKRESIFAWVEGEEVPEDLRVEAARLAQVFLGPTDARRWCELHARVESKDLRFALLVNLTALAAGVNSETDPDAVAPLVQTALHQAVHGSPSSRAEAVAILQSPGLEVHLSDGSLTDVLGSLEDGSDPELVDRVFDLIGRIGGDGAFDALLELPTLDSLLRQHPQRIGILARTLGRKARGDGTRLFRAANRLRAVEDPDTTVVRLEQALELLAQIQEQDVPGLSAEQHERLVTWAFELREAGGRLPIRVRGGGVFLDRILDAHLSPGDAGAGSPGEVARHYRRACLLADRADLEIEVPGEGTPDENRFRYRELALAEMGRVLEGMASSDASPSPIGDAPTVARVLRDRARVLDAMGRAPEALADYRRILAGARPIEAAAPGPDAAPESPWSDGTPMSELEFHDLRRITTLLTEGSPDPNPEDPTVPGPTPGNLQLAIDVQWTLIGDASWSNAPPSIRLQDMENLWSWVERSKSEVAYRTLASRFPQPIPGSREGAAPGPADPYSGDPRWSGIATDGSRRGRLASMLIDIAEHPFAQAPAHPAGSSPQTEPEGGGEGGGDTSQGDPDSDPGSDPDVGPESDPAIKPTDPGTPPGGGGSTADLRA